MALGAQPLFSSVNPWQSNGVPLLKGFPYPFMKATTVLIHSLASQAFLESPWQSS